MTAGKGKVELIADRFMPRLLRPFWERVQASSVGYRLAHGAFWSFAGTLVSRVLTLLSSIVVARMLGKDAFGELGIVQSTIAMFQAFAGFGLGLTATKHVAEFKIADPERAGRVLALSSAVAIVTGITATLCMYIFSPWLATKTLASPGLANLLRLSSTMLFLGALNGAQTGALAGFEAFKHMSKVNLLSGIATFLFMVVGVVVWGLTGTVCGLILSMVANCLLNYRALIHEAKKFGVPMHYSGCLCEWRGLWKFSLLATMSGLVVTPITWASNAIVVNQPGGYGELGVYNAVLKLKQVPETLLATVMNPILPMLSEQFANKDTAGYGKTLSVAYVMSCLIMVPTSIFAMYFPNLMLLPYGSSYAGYGLLVQWLFLHGIMVGLFSPLSSVLASTNTMWIGFVYNFAYSAFFISFALLFVPKFLGAGLAMSLCFASLIPSVLCVAYIYYNHKSFMGNFSLIKYSTIFISFGLVSIYFREILANQSAHIVGLILTVASFLLLGRRLLKSG